MPAIFVSHSSRDQKVAQDMKAALERLGFEQVFLDFDKDIGIGAGSDWEKVLYDKLARCHALILVLTPNWLNSTWCRIELAQARALGKVILPVICQPLGERYVLPEIQAVDLIDWKAGGLERIEKSLRAITNELARGFAFDPVRAPYPGIHAFEPEDAAIYFGRDDEVRSVIERLDARRTRGGSRLLVIIGASGAGKSSLLKAGVLPQLARRKRDWIVLAPVRPEKGPMEALGKAIAQQLGKPDEWRAWKERLTGPDAIGQVAELLKDLRIGQQSTATVLLPIDQFEEVFTVSTPEERAPFLRLLAGVLDPARDLPITMLATGRSDVLDGLMEAGELARLYDTQPLAPMPLDRVPRLVEGPATVASLNVEQGLAERMTRDLESSDALPLLAHTLWLLYRRRGASEKRLSLTDYQALGDLERGLNPIQNSVRLAADQALDGLLPKPTERELAALRDAFVPHLVRLRLDDGKRVRQPTRMQDLPEESRRLVRALIEARLLVFRDSQIEVAHEALFKAWPTLDRWLTEEQVFLSDLERIRSAREVWVQAPPGQQKGALLHGLLLSRARDWLLRYPQRFISQDLEPLRAFIVSSAQAEDAERARSRRARQRLFKGVAAATVIFACAAVLAGWQWYRAMTKENEAISALMLARENETRALAALSTVAAKDGSFADSINLALAGWPRDSTDPRPRLPAILDSLALALSGVAALLLREYRHDDVVLGVRLNRDESRILLRSGKTVRLWDVATGRQIGPAMTHGSVVYGARLSRDESRILSWSRDKTVRLWDVATGRQIGSPMTHDDEVSGAMLSRDESRILSWSEDKTVRVWDVATGRQIGAAMTHDGPVWGALLNWDESRILSWSRDRTVRLWDVATGRQIGPAMTHDDFVWGAMLIRDESRVLSWSRDKTVRLWDVATGRQVGPAMTHDSSVRPLLIRDETLIIALSSRALRLWDVGTGQQIGPAMTHDGLVGGAVLNRDGTHVLSWSASDNTVRLWEVATGQQIGPAMTHNDVRGALLSQDESRILSWSENDKTVRLWDAATGRQIGPAMTHDAEISGAVLSQDASHILSWSEDASVRVWDVTRGRQIGSAITHDRNVTGALLNRDETRVLSWSDDKTVRLWDVATGRQIGPAMTHDEEAWGALLTQDETRVLSWSPDKTVRLWDVATGRQIGPSMMHDETVDGAMLIRDDTRILSWSRDMTVRLWDVATGQQIGPAMMHDGDVSRATHDVGVSGALVNRDESRILSWAHDKTVRLWNMATGRQIGPTMMHDAWVRGALLNRDETRVLSWSSDKTVRLWDVATGRQIGPAMMHDKEAWGALFTRDESRILSWSSDNTLRLWDVATGRQIGAAMRHDGFVRGAMLIRNETRILSWSNDNTVRLWDVATGRQIGPAMTNDGVVLGVRLSRDESRILSWSGKSVRLWDVATGRQIGPGMMHDDSVNGALLTRDGTSVLSWSHDNTVRLWDVSWRGRNLLEIACNHSPPDHDLSAVAARYGIRIADPICQPDKVIPIE